MSKELFFDMRSNEIASSYPADFTKKEAQKTGVELVKKVLNEGNVSKLEFGANLARANEVISSAMSEFKNHIDSKESFLGVEWNVVSGGETLNYQDDPVWLELKSKIAHRESLLKIAYKSDVEFYDEEGVQVPKVSATVKKVYVTAKF